MAKVILYTLLAEAYKAKGDNEAYLNTLKIGFERYPSNQNLLGYIINYYILEAENTDEAFKYLELAIEKDPTNAHFYSAKGHLYDKMNKKEEAKVNYNKAIELKPDFFEAYYNLGVIYFNEAVALTEEANQIKDNKKYEEAKIIADKKFVEVFTIY
ncbi:MAG: tetratricopeptide repeat protein [Marinilabiliales bacterium]|nr:tetratricopeptide repeat protein [Marinilabiliales bacterium]